MSRGPREGTAVAGLVAVAQLVPAAVVAPVAASLADRRSPLFLLAGGYLVQAAAMAGTAAAIGAGSPLAAYAAAVASRRSRPGSRPPWPSGCSTASDTDLPNGPGACPGAG
jgi:hypothetical protein